MPLPLPLVRCEGLCRGVVDGLPLGQEPPCHERYLFVMQESSAKGAACAMSIADSYLSISDKSVNALCPCKPSPDVAFKDATPVPSEVEACLALTRRLTLAEGGLRTRMPTAGQARTKSHWLLRHQ